MRPSKPGTVSPRDLQDGEEVTDSILRPLVQEALDGPRPPIPAEDVFANLRALHEGRSLSTEVRETAFLVAESPDAINGELINGLDALLTDEMNDN